MALNFIAKAPANFLRFTQPRLQTGLKYAKVELTPPSPGELGQVAYWRKRYIRFKTFQVLNYITVFLILVFILGNLT